MRRFLLNLDSIGSNLIDFNTEVSITPKHDYVNESLPIDQATDDHRDPFDLSKSQLAKRLE
jgi:hypothetical protein